MKKREAISQSALSLVGLGYIYGATGWVCTEARLQAQAKQYPEYAEKIFYYGRKLWLGKVCYDCAQLTKRAAKEAGYSFVSGANSQKNMGIWIEEGTIDTLPDEAGIFLFVIDPKTGKAKHVAVTVGGGYEVEARGHAYGVVKRKIKDCAFTHWKRLPGLDDEVGTVSDPAQAPVEDSLPILRKGSQGEYVAAAQSLLKECGYPLSKWGIDGQYGAETEAAVKEFQAAIALKVDGIIGPKTWAALMDAAEAKEQPSDETPDDPPNSPTVTYMATISGLTQAGADAVKAQYPGAIIKEDT